ncbi:DUF2891 domain-containing protein [Blastomonas marina]|uniref:DUF2891 domain-containing protein n=1 Tax=Blastomonas marina TaxID=1867408 RepID=UPI002AC8983D|nr:DUF2891 domain-containing protein [Blastomonas marina]WPZ03002.1 DUF2891 domain-containing protein [Blastomonas marina]
MELTEEIARRFAKAALGHVAREYPHKLDHVMEGDEDVLSPRTLHPCFFGSYDWHSCVHGWWTLLTLRRLYPDMPEASHIALLAEATFTKEKLAVELAYAQRPASRGFERPYGWAWLLYLHLEATRHEDRDWATRVEPLARYFGEGFKAYLGVLTYPIRTGAHPNSAFALTLAIEWADRFDEELADTIRRTARGWFDQDRDSQAWEPGGDEFLSPTLAEALLMKRTLSPEEFAPWFTALLPRRSAHLPPTLFTPATVSDRTDGKIAHLDGLNLSRAWAWRELGDEVTAQRHLEAALPHVTGDYMGEHWLASFALLALRARA